MTVLEKIKRCVSLVWDFQEFYGDEDIEDFCSNELDTYSQYNEILDYFKRITELEQENKVLAQNLEDTEIVNKALEKENAELKRTKEGKVVEHFEAYGQCRDSRRIAELEAENAELKSENQKWKDEWQEQVQKATDEGYARTLQTMQLSKAKELIKNLMVYVPVDLKEYEEAKQFLNSEIEK